ncbi:hypothetical protein B5V02_37305 [Mesorhizobium kowhaii]|jgi:hypothetical protein|uniref:Uncharacterized protein n=1 Tax=Mesorhizobium kowhaii TaxID=1300272 RepID=A0A2W7DQ87_9HYPH|nr:hypothetical protein B5V02_37305 [Mesorhizobium kowhaii]
MPGRPELKIINAAGLAGGIGALCPPLMATPVHRQAADAFDCLRDPNRIVVSFRGLTRPPLWRQ